MKVNKNGKIILNEKTLNEIKKIKKNISVLSVIGPYRSGKSFLLNRFKNKQNGFEIGNSTNPCTEGVWVWGSSNISDDKNIETLLIDTEGLFAYNRDEQADLNLFLFTSMISSLMIYNTFGVIDESALERFSFLSELGKYFQFSNKKKNDLVNYFPHLVWLLRDFALELKDLNNNKNISAKNYFELALMENNDNIIKDLNESYINKSCQSNLRLSTIGQYKNKKDIKRMKNKIRKKFKEIFRTRNCFTLVRPVNEEKYLREIDRIPYENLREEFKEELENIMDYVKDNLSVKKFKNVKMNGESFVEYIKIIADSINSEQIPKITTVWDRIEKNQIDILMEKALVKFNNGIKDLENKNIFYDNEIDKKIDVLKNNILIEILDNEFKGTVLKKVLLKFNKQIEFIIDDYKTRNKKSLKNLRNKQKKEIVNNFRNYLNNNEKNDVFLFEASKEMEKYIKEYLPENELKKDISSFLEEFLHIFTNKLQAKEIQRTKERNLIEIELTKIESRYEANKEILKKQTVLMNKMMEDEKFHHQINIENLENKIFSIKESYENKIVKMKSEISKNFDSKIDLNVQNQIDNKEHFDELKNIINILNKKVEKNMNKKNNMLEKEEEKINLENKYKNEIEMIRKKHEDEIYDIKKKNEEKLEALQRENKKLFSLREDNSYNLLRQEAEIKILKEKIRSDMKYKNTQVEFSSVLCNISDQVMHLLNKIEKKV